MPQILTAVAMHALHENTANENTRREAQARAQEITSGMASRLRRRRASPQQPRSYSTAVRYRPSGAKVGAARLRSRLASTSASHDGGRAAIADLDQATDEVAHHVVQERVGGKLEQHQLAEALHARPTQLLYRRARLAFGSAEGAEVVAGPTATAPPRRMRSTSSGR